MLITETNGDMFKVFKENPNAVACHCIAQDYKLGAGIAFVFEKEFNLKSVLKTMKLEIGKSYKINNVYNLITKPISSQKPIKNKFGSCDMLYSALEDMKKQIIQNKEHHLIMPCIGSGLDNLNWESVKKDIITIFDNIHKLHIDIYKLR